MRVDRVRCQRDGFLELFDGFCGVGRRQSRAEIGVRLRVVGTDSHSLTQRRNALVVFSGLDQHEAKMIVSFGEIRLQVNGLAKLRRDFTAVSAAAPEEEAEDVMRFCSRPRWSPGGRDRVRAQGLAKSGDRAVPVGHRTRR